MTPYDAWRTGGDSPLGECDTQCESSPDEDDISNEHVLTLKRWADSATEAERRLALDILTQSLCCS